MNAQHRCRDASLAYRRVQHAPSQARRGQVAARRALRTTFGMLSAPALRLHRYRDLHARMLEGALRAGQRDE